MNDNKEQFGTGAEGNVKRSEFNLITSLIIGILVVFGVTVVSLGIQYFTATQATFQDLKDQVVAQNTKMDMIILQLRSAQIIN